MMMKIKLLILVIVVLCLIGCTTQEDVFSKPKVEDFELKLYANRTGNLIKFHLMLTYNGSRPCQIYYGHIHPFRVEIYRDNTLIAILPNVTLDVLKIKTMQPHESISIDLLYPAKKGVYRAVAYAELAFENPIKCYQLKKIKKTKEICLKRIYSNEITVVVN